MGRNRHLSRLIFHGVGVLAVVTTVAVPASAVLYIYEPFDYTAGASLGGSGGTAIGQQGTYVGGGDYNWYARQTGGANSHDPARDAVISTGNLSYPGLAASQGNSVSYGSALPNAESVGGAIIPENDAFNRSLYGDTIALPNEVTSGSLYASFIIRIKSEVEDGTTMADRYSPAMFTMATSTAADAGNAIPTVQSGSNARVASFFLRRDPVDPTLNSFNFGVGKSSGDGVSPGQNAIGDNAGWQNSDPTAPPRTEANQFGDKDGQLEPIFSDSNTWQTYFVVLKYEFDFVNASSDDYDAPGSTPGSHDQDDTVSIWINPNPATLGIATGEVLASQDPSANAGSYYAATDAYGAGTLDMDAIRSFALIGHRQTRNETAAIDFDELRIGTTWADVTPAASASQPGDHNGDGAVDAADYVAWRKLNIGGSGGYDEFFEHFGEGSSGDHGHGVPEPSSLMLIAACALCWRARGRSSRRPRATSHYTG